MIIIQPWFLFNLEFLGTLEVRESDITTVPVRLPFLVPILKLGSICGKILIVRQLSFLCRINEDNRGGDNRSLRHIGNFS